MVDKRTGKVTYGEKNARGGKQLPAVRTVWHEKVMFHVTGTNDYSDFSSYSKAVKRINAGREVTAYYLRTGYTMHRGSERVTPTITKKHIATVSRKCSEYERKMRRIMSAMGNNGKQGQTNTF